MVSDAADTKSQSISAYGPARSSVSGLPLRPEELQRMQRYWDASLYLSAGMIYLRDNPLLREPLEPSTPSAAYWVTGVPIPE